MSQGSRYCCTDEHLCLPHILPGPPRTAVSGIAPVGMRSLGESRAPDGAARRRHSKAGHPVCQAAGTSAGFTKPETLPFRVLQARARLHKPFTGAL